MKLEPTLSYGDNVLFCIFEPGEDCSESTVTSRLEAEGYTAWGIAQEAGISEAIAACQQEKVEKIVLAPVNWDPASGIMPQEYMIFGK